MFLTPLISIVICMCGGLPIAKSDCAPRPQPFACANGECAFFVQKCDGKWDCSDGSDEYGCQFCSSDQLMCYETQTCVPHSQVCDGHQDCKYGTDELGTNCGAVATASQDTTSSYTYLFFVIPAIVLFACLVCVGLCAVAVVLYSKEKYGHRRRVTAVDVNGVDIVAMSGIVQHDDHSTPGTRSCAGGKSVPYLVVDPPPSYNQNMFSRSPPPPYSSEI